MGAREGAIPLRRLSVCAVVVLWALTSRASAQPTEFFLCPWLGQAHYSCLQLHGGATIFAECIDPPGENIFLNYIGPIAWYPVRCVGPITVAVETFSPAHTRFPVYVEVVPLGDSADFPWVCENLPGKLIHIVYGRSYISAPCGFWDETRPIDITKVVPLGSLYAIRLYFFTNIFGSSPFLGCVRVTAHPVESMSVTEKTWGDVKVLYR